MSKKLFDIVAPVLTVIVICLCWEILTIYSLIDAQFFPPPHLFIARCFILFKGNFLSYELLPSLMRLGIATFLTVPIATILAIIAGSSQGFDKIFNPLFALTYPLPKVAIFPLLLLTFGIGDESKIALISIGIFYLTYINVRNGTLKIHHSPLMNIVKIYKISGWDYYYHFLFKGILRDLLIGLKTALGYGLVLIVVSEFSISKNGIGHFIWQSWEQFQVVDMYAGILVLSVLGCFITYVLDYFIDKNCHF